MKSDSRASKQAAAKRREGKKRNQGVETRNERNGSVGFLGICFSVSLETNTGSDTVAGYLFPLTFPHVLLAMLIRSRISATTK